MHIDNLICITSVGCQFLLTLTGCEHMHTCEQYNTITHTFSRHSCELLAKWVRKRERGDIVGVPTIFIWANRLLFLVQRVVNSWWVFIRFAINNEKVILFSSFIRSILKWASNISKKFSADWVVVWRGLNSFVRSIFIELFLLLVTSVIHFHSGSQFNFNDLEWFN